MKNRLLKILVALGLIIGFLSMPVKADVAIGVIGNWSTFDTAGTEEEAWGTSSKAKIVDVNSDTHSEDVDFGSIFIEAVGKGDWAGMTFGVEYIPGDASIGTKTRTDTAGGDVPAEADSGDYTGKAEISDHFTVYIEPTIYASDWIGVYLKGGASRVTVRSLEAIANGASSSAYGDVDVWGGMVGYGLRLKHSSGALLKTEYTRTNYEGVTLMSTSGNKNRIKADPKQESVRIAIGWQF